MKDFARYLRLVTSRYFKGPMGWILDLISIASLLASIKFPVFPLWIGFAVFFINTLLITFFIWQEESKKVAKSEAELQKLKDAIPRYSIIVGDIKMYSVQDLIRSNDIKIAKLKQKIESVKSPSASNSIVGGGLWAGTNALQEFTKSLLPAMHSLGNESDKDQLERLKKYHTELLQHEYKLKNLYQISLSIESTRYDKNVEVEIDSEDTYTMTVDDDYETVDLSVAKRLDNSWLASVGQQSFSVVSKYYLHSYAEDNKAFSELAYINAFKTTLAFDSAYYVRSKKDKIMLQIKIHSTKLNKPQQMDVIIDLSSAPIIQISDSTA